MDEKNILDVVVAPYKTYSDDFGGYWLNGRNIALNAEAYKVGDNQLLKIFDLEIDSNVSSLENERLVNLLGETFETIEEYLQINYKLEDIDEDTNIIIKFEG